jgi:hypothetical protein
MNFQDLLYPVKDLMLWTFELIMEGSLPEFVNWSCVGVGALLLLLWIREQTKFDKKAAASGKLA